MSTYHNSETYEIIHGEINFQIIDQYLSIKDAVEVARLAAAMTPKSKSPSPRELIDAALSLQEEAEQGLIRMRVKVLSKMNLQTALEIGSHLGVLDKLHLTEKDPVHNDPVKGPVISLLKKIFAEDTKSCIEDNKRRIENTLSMADSRTKLTRPTLPCDLDLALRYAVNDSDVPWDVLERSFIDFLGIYASERAAKQECDYRTDIKEQFKRDTLYLANLKQETKTNPEAKTQHKQLEEELKGTEKLIKEWKNEKFYCECFTPDQETPSDIKLAAEVTYRAYWKRPKLVKDSESLYFLATDYFAFWKKHSKEYLDRHKKDEANKKKTSSRNKKSAPKGPQIRDHNKWLRRCRDFKKFQDDQLQTNKSADVKSQIELFVDSKSGLKDKDAKKMLSDTLDTFCNPGNRQASASNLLPLLRNCRNKAISENTIIECLAILHGASKAVHKKM